MTVFYGYLFGFPADWVIFGFIGIIAVVFIGVILYFFTGGEKGPIEEDLALIVPEDEHGTLQTGQLVGKVERTEDTIIVTVPEWQDDDGNQYTGELDLTSGGGTKIALPFRDAGTKGTKKLWFISDKGDLTVASITTLLHGLPKRWDPPLADRRKTIRFLVSSHPGQTITNALTTPTGALVIIGLLGGGMLLSFFLVTVSGHLR